MAPEAAAAAAAASSNPTMCDNTNTTTINSVDIENGSKGYMPRVLGTNVKAMPAPGNRSLDESLVSMLVPHMLIYLARQAPRGHVANEAEVQDLLKDLLMRLRQDGKDPKSLGESRLMTMAFTEMQQRIDRSVEEAHRSVTQFRLDDPTLSATYSAEELANELCFLREVGRYRTHLISSPDVSTHT